MNYLAFDTSTDICSVTFFYNSNYYTKVKKNVREHSEFLPVFCSELINNKINEIDFIAISVGPGSYSGLKVSSSFAKGLSLAINKPIVPINAFESINLSIEEKKEYYIAIYSHRDYAFYQKYHSGKFLEKAKCNKISNINNFKVFGYGLKEHISDDKFVEIEPSSQNIGQIAHDNFKLLVKTDVNDVEPILLSKDD